MSGLEHQKGNLVFYYQYIILTVLLVPTKTATEQSCGAGGIGGADVPSELREIARLAVALEGSQHPLRGPRDAPAAFGSSAAVGLRELGGGYLERNEGP